MMSSARAICVRLLSRASTSFIRANGESGSSRRPAASRKLPIAVSGPESPRTNVRRAGARGLACLSSIGCGSLLDCSDMLMTAPAEPYETGSGRCRWRALTYIKGPRRPPLVLKPEAPQPAPGRRARRSCRLRVVHSRYGLTFTRTCAESLAPLIWRPAPDADDLVRYDMRITRCPFLPRAA